MTCFKITIFIEKPKIRNGACFRGIWTTPWGAPLDNGTPTLSGEPMNPGCGHVHRSSWWHRIKDSFFIAFEEEFCDFHQLNNTIHAPAALRPIIESIAAEGGYQNNVII